VRDRVVTVAKAAVEANEGSLRAWGELWAGFKVKGYPALRAVSPLGLSYSLKGQASHDSRCDSPCLNAPHGTPC
jgi:hypothetical protein